MSDYHDEYTDDEQNAQLRIFRTLSEEEQRWVARCERRVAQLLNSLAPEDARRPLFSFAERTWFNIPRSHRPRPKE